IAMPFLQGESLASRLEREGRLPAAEVLRIGREVAEGLAAAHERGLIHRDIKPANIWLETRTRRVKILDFGLVRAPLDPTPAAPAAPGPLAAMPAALTQTGAIVGTPAYMAPEQTRGPAVDARSDLFSLGCVLYQMSTGRPAFQGGDPLSVLAAVATEQP